MAKFQIRIISRSEWLPPARVFAALIVIVLIAGCDHNNTYTDRQIEQPVVLPVPPPAAVECRFAEGEITIDGVADEPAWKNAVVIDNFYLPWLKDKARPSRTKTQARLLWDREYLYFYAEMEDTDLYASVTEHDGPTWNDDVFELFFKPAADKPGYYEFEVNAANTVLDMFLPRRNAGGYERFKNERAFSLQTAVKLRGTLNKWTDKDEGWSVEGRIPWRDFIPTGGRPAENETWSFALCRADVSVDADGVEYSSNAPLKEFNFHRFEDYVPLKFIGPSTAAQASEAPFGIDKRIAWNDSHVAGTPDPPPPFRVKRAFPNITIPCPIHVYHEPGTENLFLLHQLWPWSGPGRILRIKDDPNVKEIQTLLAPERLFYGVAFDPQYEKNGYVFTGSNGEMTSKQKTTRVSRYTIKRSPPYDIDPKSEVVIIEWPSDGHNGGDLVFGNDGMLYVTSGDGTSDSDKNLVGQDLSKLNSKVLRIDVEHPAPGQNYSVPPDNPFVNQEGVRPETWAYGMRNPWRITCDPKTGILYVGQNGQDLWEQVYAIEKGANYGWSIVEGTHPFYPDRKRGPQPISKPIMEHPHSESRSLTGGQVYHGTLFPELEGMYIYGDWSTGKIWGLKYDGQRVVKQLELASTPMHVTGIGFDSHGELLIADHGSGSYFQLERMPVEQNPRVFPRRLSDTGLFLSVKDHKPHPGLIGYSVNSPLWSDGAFKERFIAMPGADSQIEYKTERGWEFPDGAILVKSFALEKERGNPQSRHWIETRLMVKQMGLWAGYTYMWNDEQDDAVLVEKGGLDRDYSIQDPAAPGGVRKQTWHYPSHAECMICHSRAFNFILGLSETQMNKMHDYGGIKDNQLRALEHIGLFKVNWMDCEQSILWHEAKAMGKTDTECGEYAAAILESRLQREAPFSYSKLLPRALKNSAHLVDPYDAHNDLNARARSYLQANCAHCHVSAGGGNAMMELEYATPAKFTNIFNVKPLHDNFDIPNAKLIATGSPERSILLHRISMRGPGQMPQLATSVVDEETVKLLKEWIGRMRGE